MKKKVSVPKKGLNLAISISYNHNTCFEMVSECGAVLKGARPWFISYFQCY